MLRLGPCVHEKGTDLEFECRWHVFSLSPAVRFDLRRNNADQMMAFVAELFVLPWSVVSALYSGKRTLEVLLDRF